MPTTYLYRLWCKECKDWTLHSKAWKENIPKCKDCDTEFSPIKLKEVPKDKLIEQRGRYKENQKKDFSSMLMGGIMSNPLDEFFSEDFPDPIIIESDAGQKTLDKIKVQKEKVKMAKERTKRAEEYAEALKYKNLGRNDICLCGSEKKYKKCCLPKINKIWL